MTQPPAVIENTQQRFPVKHINVSFSIRRTESPPVTVVGSAEGLGRTLCLIIPTSICFHWFQVDRAGEGFVSHSTDASHQEDDCLIWRWGMLWDRGRVWAGVAVLVLVPTVANY